MRFSKKKMIERITREGRAEMIDAEALEIMEKLDGRHAGTNSWRRQIFDEPVLVVTDADGKTWEVNELDCE